VLLYRHGREINPDQIKSKEVNKMKTEELMEIRNYIKAQMELQTSTKINDDGDEIIVNGKDYEDLNNMMHYIDCDLLNQM